MKGATGEDMRAHDPFGVHLHFPINIQYIYH